MEIIVTGKVSIALLCDWMEPYSQDSKDVEAAERALQFKVGWFAHPIFVNGDYPDVMKELVANKSKAEGRSLSRLPEFTDVQKQVIRGYRRIY